MSFRAGYPPSDSSSEMGDGFYSSSEEYEDDDEEWLYDDDEDDEDEEAEEMSDEEYKLVIIAKLNSLFEPSSEKEFRDFLLDLLKGGDKIESEALHEWMNAELHVEATKRLCRLVLSVVAGGSGWEQAWILTSKGSSVVLCETVEYCAKHISLEEWTDEIMGAVFGVFDGARRMFLKLREIEATERRRTSERIQRSKPIAIRPGTLCCDFYMDNGYCRYGLECRFHHPPERLHPNYSSHEKAMERDGASEKDMDTIILASRLLGRVLEYTEPQLPAPTDGMFRVCADDKPSKKAKILHRPQPLKPSIRNDLERIGIYCNALTFETDKIECGLKVVDAMATHLCQFFKALTRKRFRSLVRKLQDESLAVASTASAPRPKARAAGPSPAQGLQALQQPSRTSTVAKDVFVVSCAPIPWNKVGYAISPGRVAWSSDERDKLVAYAVFDGRSQSFPPVKELSGPVLSRARSSS